MVIFILKTSPLINAPFRKFHALECFFNEQYSTANYNLMADDSIVMGQYVYALFHISL